MVQVENRQWR